MDNSIFKKQYIGKRKTTTVRLCVYDNGTGKFIVNKRPLNFFFPNQLVTKKIIAPFLFTEILIKDYDYKVNVFGGGKASWATAIQNALARFVAELNPTLRKILKDKKLLNFDLRFKERKKYGLKKARRAPQFSKR